MIGVLFALLMLIGLTRSAVALLEWQKFGMIPREFYLGIGWRVAVLASIAFILFQLPKRSQLARWGGALLIAGLLFIPIYLALSMEPPDAGSPGELLGFIIGFLLTFLPIAYWLYAFAFSRKARAYFSSPARN